MKKWNVPTQKGTALWPSTTVAPPRLVIHSVKSNTPLFHSVAQRYAARLNHFIAACRQSYSLSVADVAKHRISFGDATASYANMQGQELIYLEVDQVVLNELVKKPDDYPDWAVVDIHVPDSNDIAVYFSAATVRPSVGARTDHLLGDIIPINGIELDDPGFYYYLTPPGADYSGWVEDPLIEYANYGLQNATAPSTDGRISSIKVDLRRILPGDVVLFDIYGWIFPRVEVLDTTASLGWDGPYGRGSLFGRPVPADFYDPSCITASVTYYVYKSGLGSPIPDAYDPPEANPDYPGGRWPQYPAYFTPTNFLGPWILDETYPVFEYLAQGEPVFDRVAITFGSWTVGGVTYGERETWTLDYFENVIYSDAYERFGDGFTPYEVRQIRDCPMTYQFYEDGQTFLHGHLPSYDAVGSTAMWLTSDGQFPGRARFSTVRMDSNDTPDNFLVSDDNPNSFKKLCRVLVDRKYRVVRLVPLE